MTSSMLVRACSAVCAAVFAVAALPAGAADSLPSPVSIDLNESLHLLRTTFYHPIDDQAILDSARNALIDAARDHHVRVAIPELHAGDSDDTVATALTGEIENVAAATHVTPTEMAYATIEAMAKSVGDRYTQFFTPDQYKMFNQALDPQRISGIGVLIQTDEATKDIALSYVIPGTPADHAGLHAGDVITAIDGTPAKNMSNQDASKLLRGKPGTIVHLSVATTAGETHPDVAVTRSEVQPPTVVFKMLPDAIGYIAVIAFGRATPNEFDTALLRVKDAGARAVVLDLRNDGGGYVDSALDIVSRFVARKPMLTIEERGVPPKTYSAADDVMLALPMTVLVNQYTASASEITAGALQDDGIGEIVGTRTFGKGVMQTLTPLPDGAAIKITTAHYLTPLKRDINLKGIDPDVRIDENHDARFGEIGKDAQLRAALALLQKKIAQVP